VNPKVYLPIKGVAIELALELGFRCSRCSLDLDWFIRVYPICFHYIHFILHGHIHLRIFKVNSSMMEIICFMGSHTSKKFIHEKKMFDQFTFIKFSSYSL